VLALVTVFIRANAFCKWFSAPFKRSIYSCFVLQIEVHEKLWPLNPTPNVNTLVASVQLRPTSNIAAIIANNASAKVRKVTKSMSATATTRGAGIIRIR
jgi:hypothetical protein